MANDYPEMDKQDNMPPEEAEQPKADNGPSPIQIEGDIRQEDLVTRLMGWKTDWETWRRPYETLWQEIYRMYMSSSNFSKTVTRAKIFIPIVFQVVESAISKFVALVFNQEEFFEVVPMMPDDEPMAKVIEKLLYYQLNKAAFFVKYIDFTKQLLMYGTSYFKVYWKVKRQWVWKREPIREQVTFLGFTVGSKIVGWNETKSYEVVERGPTLDVLDILDVFPDPTAETEQDGRGIFIRTYMSLEDIKNMGTGKYPIYANTDSPLLENSKKNDDPAHLDRLTVRGVSDSSRSKGMVEVVEYWGCYDLDGDGIKEEVNIVIGNSCVLLRAVANPFHHQKRPIVRGVLFPVPKEFFGIGMVEPVMQLQAELNTIRRQRLDNVNLALNRMWKVNSLADVDVETLVSTPNGIILTDDMAGVEALPTPDVTSSAYTDAATIQSDIENVTVPRSVQGIPESGRLGRTARGAQLIIGQALEKFGLAAKLQEEMVIKVVLRRFHQLNLQFIDSEDVQKEIGMKADIFDQKVTPEMIRAEVGFKMVGISDMIGKEGKINQMISFVGVFKDILSGDSLAAISSKVWALMGFNPKDIEITPAPQVSKQIVVGKDAQDNQQTSASLQAQAARNGASATPSVPGSRSS